MASKQVRSIRNKKDRPNKANLKKRQDRIKRNLEILDKPFKEV